MALVKCQDCGKEISSEAVSCPDCGRPSKTSILESTKKRSNLLALKIIIIVLLIVAVSWVFFYFVILPELQPFFGS